jgi:heparan-alpha-glucosaminide N-acetyltransferase
MSTSPSSATQPEGATAPPHFPATARLASLDACRGLIMLLLASVGFGLGDVAKSYPDSAFWGLVRDQISHAEWAGCKLWDLIQPAFMFMVGVSMPFSFASRRTRGESPLRLAGHVVKRSLVLILLGVFLMSDGSARTNFTFVNVLTQIGLAYGFAALTVGRGPAVQGLALLGILGGYWLAFAVHPLPGPAFDLASVGVPAGWPHNFDGFFAHWNKNTNLAAAADLTIMNWFPRAEPFSYNEGGYQTLNFVPSMATLILGIMAGELLRGPRPSREKLSRLFVAAIACLAAGWVLGGAACPIVKRIWSPSWTIYAGGWTLLLLAALHAIVDVIGWRRWAFPLVVVGMNPITVYCLFMVSRGWIRESIETHLGRRIFQGPWGPFLAALAVTGVIWLVCLWMYRRKIFIRA